MSRKFIIIILVISSTLNLIACRSNKSTLKTDSNIIINIDNKNLDNNSIIDCYGNSTINIRSDDDSYKILDLTYSKKDSLMNCDIKYPQISGMVNSSKQQKINNILREEAIKGLNYYNYKGREGFLELQIDYKFVLSNKAVLSIQYSGVGYVSNAAHPNGLFYTTNINIKTGQRFRLADIINIDRNFAKKILNGEFKPLWPKQIENKKWGSYEEIQEMFIKADSLDNIGTDQHSDEFSYLTSDSLGISVNVCHAIGDHAELEIKYKDIEDIIKTENEIWKNLFKPT